ncbi:MAG TPA: heme ABC transporter ATP-binding protein [Gemmatimonadales bacterium]|nr:heme ABC transporter ATP-binding protein [Gemmatimonadales bacterium]
MSVLEARRLAYAVDEAVLVDGVDLRAEPGELLGIVGPNGAGKSTLIRLLSGELPPTGGEVLIGGRSLRHYRPRDLALLRSVLPQQTVLQFAFRVREVVGMGRYPHRHSSAAEDLASVAEAMDRVEVTHLADRLYPTLSGGEQTRTSIARVLAQDGPALLLDEPTASLDIRHQELVMGVLSDLRSAGVGVIAVLHDLNLAARYADRVGLMDQGRMVALGLPEEVLRADLLTEVYAYPVAVEQHPLLDCPLILPLRSS